MARSRVRIPTPLRSFTGGASEVEIDGRTVGEALASLSERHPGLRERLLDEEGRVRPFVNVFVGSDELRALEGLETELDEGAVISIIPAVAGGGVR